MLSNVSSIADRLPKRLLRGRSDGGRAWPFHSFGPAEKQIFIYGSNRTPQLDRESQTFYSVSGGAGANTSWGGPGLWSLSWAPRSALKLWVLRVENSFLFTSHCWNVFAPAFAPILNQVRGLFCCLYHLLLIFLPVHLGSPSRLVPSASASAKKIYKERYTASGDVDLRGSHCRAFKNCT